MYDEDDIWTLYKDRLDWKDVEPIPQDDGPYTVVAIAYKEKFKDVYGYFRAILKSKEKSERSLQLTNDALDLNPGNYSVWQYRREILKELNKNLSEELSYTEGMMRAYEKNYQVWHHRRVIVEWASDASNENRVTKQFLSTDPKNYHAWQHRQWYISTFNLFDGELDYVEQLIDEDVRNNSAWNQRYFVNNFKTAWTNDLINNEVDYTLNKIKLVTKNESSWNYLRGVMFHADENSLAYDKVKKFCDNLFNGGNRSPYLLAYMIDMCDEYLDKNKRLPDEGILERALQLCDLLANEVDTIRCQYWEYIKKNLQSKVVLYRSQ